MGFELFFVIASKYKKIFTVKRMIMLRKKSPLYKITVSVEINIYLTAELTSKKAGL